MEKKDLRKKIGDAIKKMTDEEKILYSEKICQKIFNLEIYRNCDYVFSYIATKNELDTGVLNQSSSCEKKLFLPKTQSSGRIMDFYEMSGDFENSLAPGRYGIKEPREGSKMLDLLNCDLSKKKILMIVPAVAFSENKNRLGHGMGFYDIYIERIKKVLQQNDGEIFLLGVCFPCQIDNDVDHVSEMHDIKMDMVLF